MTISPSIELLDAQRKPQSVAGKIYRLEGVLYYEDSPLTETAVIELVNALQAQIDAKAPILNIEYLTGTSVLSDAQTAILINSVTDCNIFLPPGVNNRSYRIRNVGTGKVTFKPFGSNTVEKDSSYTLLTANAFDLAFYLNNWYIF